jgi:cell division protein FtsL
MTITATDARARVEKSPAGPRDDRRSLRAVPERQGQARRGGHVRAVVVLLCAALVVGSLLAVVGSYAYLTQGQVRLARMDQQLENQVAEQRALELQVAELEQPSRVLSDAQKQGLVVPARVTVLPQVTVPAATGVASRGR